LDSGKFACAVTGSILIDPITEGKKIGIPMVAVELEPSPITLIYIGYSIST